jgi:hypothetical protein
VPVNETVWVLGDALSATVSVPVREKIAVGLNVSVTVQLAPALNEPPHVVDSEKSPPAVMLVRASAAVPVLVTITDCAALAVPTFSSPKLRLVADNFTPGAVPVPLKDTVWVAGDALSLIVSVPVLVPTLAGAKVTLMAQIAPAATDVLQVLV